MLGFLALKLDNAACRKVLKRQRNRNAIAKPFVILPMTPIRNFHLQPTSFGLKRILGNDCTAGFTGNCWIMASDVEISRRWVSHDGVQRNLPLVVSRPSNEAMIHCGQILTSDRTFFAPSPAQACYIFSSYYSKNTHFSHSPLSVYRFPLSHSFPASLSRGTSRVNAAEDEAQHSRL